ncbi:MAG: ABC transporter ATP-binding protein [Acidobacteriota bacterium]|nr:ABC transporter ATP-binding protein [Acidobacteriota bacterium]MDQ5835249.1 ABC transporter ATP-binding protein [Acidobacteriota bacterium]
MDESGQMQSRLPKQAIRLRHLQKTYVSQGSHVTALEDFSCDIADGEFAVILGPSGCGKSTAVRIIAGLETPSSGIVLVDGTPVTQPGKTCGMVFQSYTSFPWLTVIQNIEFGLRYNMRGTRAARRERARAFAQMVGLEEFEDAYITQLSGGMKQRVAIASALATDPKILLMDEPFGALDSQTRMEMQEQLLGITEASNKTVVFVTHDIDEALLLGDRIYVCTARPASILAELDVPFPHPRTPALRSMKKFVDMKYEIFHLLRNQAHGRTLEGTRELRK